MKIHGLEKLSLVDYDGFVSATIFSGNCNFRCPFCHNALLVTDFNSLPTFSEEEVFDYLNKRKGILEGVCISGGEPTLNKDLPEFIEKIKKLGYKVKLDTNGTNPEMIKTLFSSGLIDYVAMDIKNNFDDYSAVIGLDSFDISNIKKSVEFLFSNNYDYEFRTTLISEFHKEKNILLIGKDIKGAKKYFMQKFKNGENCLNAKTLNEVPIDTAKRFVEIIKPFIPSAKLRGYDL